MTLAMRAGTVATASPEGGLNRAMPRTVGPIAGDDDQPYEVGYGRPPKHSQVAKGQVLNATGRPKGSKNKPKRAAYLEPLKALIREEVYRLIPIDEGDRTRQMPIIQVALRATGVNAAKGRVGATELLVKTARALEREDRKETEETLRFWLQYKHDWEHKKRMGKAGTPPIPHPDDVHIDIVEGTVWFSGPVTRDQKKVADRLPDLIPEFEEELRELKAKRDDPARRDKPRVLKQIGKVEKVLSFLRSSKRKEK